MMVVIPKLRTVIQKATSPLLAGSRIQIARVDGQDLTVTVILIFVVVVDGRHHAQRSIGLHNDTG